METKNKDEFNTIKLKLTETINEVSKKQEERDNAFNKNGRSVAVIRLGVEIQDGFTDLNTQLGQMKEALRRQRKNTKVNWNYSVDDKSYSYRNIPKVRQKSNNNSLKNMLR